MNELSEYLLKKKPRKYHAATMIPDYIWIGYGIPIPETEYRFHEKRLWRVDFAWPEIKLAVEIEGGVFTKGRHVRGQGYINDMEKYNSLQLKGWLLLRYTPKLINYQQIKQAIEICA